MKSAGGVTYTYDGNGNRVEKSSGTLYWRGLGGNVLNPQSLNRYAYVNNNPASFFDPLGLRMCLNLTAGGCAPNPGGYIGSNPVGPGPGFPGAGADGSVSIQFEGSNANTVCGLRGPFENASGTFGLEGAAATADVFQGNGNGPNGTVTGGGVSLGLGGGASASMGGTTTTVVPLGKYSCP